MKKFVYLIILVLFCSCEETGVPMGTVKYYPSFLWVEACMKPAEQTYHFDFSPDAKLDTFCFAEFQFVDNAGNPIDTNTMRIMVGDEWLAENKLKVTNDVDSLSLNFIFTPQAEGGQHQGYFRLVNYNLDRLDSQTLDGTQLVDAFQWTFQYEKSMNPLAKLQMWVGIIIVILLVIWFVLLRPIFFPCFGSIQKTFVVPGMAPLIVRFKGARMVVIAASHQKKQSEWNRLWKGKIVYMTHPAFVSPITFKPSRGRQVLVRFETGIYQVSPNPIPGIGSATIVSIQKNLKINVN